MSRELVISGNIVDVVNKAIFKGELRIVDGVIENIISKDDVDDVYILPGLIDSHIHIESSMLIPSEFAKIAVKFGTVATVSDPHEIANVLGIEGVEFMINNGKQVPFNFYFGAPSCVPATPFETAGFNLGIDDIKYLLKKKEIKYLSEMMNYPGVIFNDKEVMGKIDIANSLGKPIDGHAPGLIGHELDKYAKAGITTDHECFTKEEAIEKIKRGMKIQIREGSAAKNFNALYTLIDEYPDEVMLCSDDLHPDDLITGHIDKLIRHGLEKGLDIFNLLRAVTVNPIKHYNLPLGLLQIGDNADLIVIDSFEKFEIHKTYIKGNLVASNGKSYINYNNEIVLNNFSCSFISEKQIVVKGKKGDKINVIEAIDSELITNRLVYNAKVDNGLIITDIEEDLLKIVVVNRYNDSKPIVGFIKGFGLKKGAIGSSIAHDSHNIIAVGTNDLALTIAINSVISNKGGISAYDNSTDCETLALNIAGIMTSNSSSLVAAKYKKLTKLAQGLGSELNSPFMTLSFMALLVIPHLKIGDKGLFDGDKFEFTELINYDK